jgi:hypothetical protein
MLDRRRIIIFAVSLIAVSMVLYGLHYIIFRDLQHIFIYGLSELAFLPIEVLLVMLVIERLLEASEKRAMLNKLNMVIGAFFSEVGTGFMSRVFHLDAEFDKNRKNFLVTPEWTDKMFDATKHSVGAYEYRIRVNGPDMVDLKEFLVGKREFMLALLENPNLLEHEEFSDVLWSTFHLTEELDARTDVTKLSRADYDHIALDTKRAYMSVLASWVDYMKHLKNSYPYLFSLAVRTNPFDPNAKAEIP